MSRYLFGVSRKPLTRAAARAVRAIAKRHECTLYETSDKRWFSGPNRGHPFDGWMRDAVYNDIRNEIPEALDNEESEGQ